MASSFDFFFAPDMIQLILQMTSLHGRRSASGRSGMEEIQACMCVGCQVGDVSLCDRDFENANSRIAKGRVLTKVMWQAHSIPTVHTCYFELKPQNCHINVI